MSNYFIAKNGNSDPVLVILSDNTTFYFPIMTIEEAKANPPPLYNFRSIKQRMSLEYYNIKNHVDNSDAPLAAKLEKLAEEIIWATMYGIALPPTEMYPNYQETTEHCTGLFFLKTTPQMPLNTSVTFDRQSYNKN